MELSSESLRRSVRRFWRSQSHTRFLTGDVEGAKADLLESTRLVPSFTQSLVKLASVYMEQGDPRQAFDCFEQAIEQNAMDPDIYYHRGQGAFVPPFFHN